MSYLLHTLFCFHFGAVFEYYRHIFLALSYNFLHWTAPKGIVKFCDNAFLVFQDCDESAHLFIPCFIVRNCGADFIVLRFQSVIAFHQGIVAFIVIILVLCHSCVLCYRILRKFYRHSDFFLQGITLGFQFRIM